MAILCRAAAALVGGFYRNLRSGSTWAYQDRRAACLQDPRILIFIRQVVSAGCLGRLSRQTAKTAETAKTAKTSAAAKTSPDSNGANGGANGGALASGTLSSTTRDTPGCVSGGG